MKDGISAPSEELEKLQKIIDIDKWLASEKAGKDLCGEASYCGYCVKAETYPCARAALRERAANQPKDISDEVAATVSEYGPDEETEEILKEENAEEKAEESLAGRELVTRYRRSFRSRLIQNENIQEFYSQLKNNILGYAGVKCRMSFHYESFRVGKSLIAKFNVSGKTLCLYLALAPSLYENGKYRFEDVSAKKTYALVPMKLKITSGRAMNYAKELIKQLATRYDLANVGSIYMEYRYAYASDDSLIAKGLIKPYTVAVRAK